MIKGINTETQKALDKIVKDLMENVSADPVTIVSLDGLPIASAGEAVALQVLNDVVAMWATALGAIVTAEACMGRLPPNSLTVDGEKDCTIIVGAGPKALLALRSQCYSKTDLEQIQEAVDEIKMLLG